MSRLESDLHVAGNLTANSMTIPDNAVTNASVIASAAIVRSKLAQTVLAEYPIELFLFRVWDAMQTNLPGTSAADALGLIGGTFGSASPLLQTYDVKAAGAVTLRARVTIPVPIEYDAGETLTIRVRGGMTTTIADTSATVDIEAYRFDEDGGVSADLCTTAAQSINSLTKADKDFVVTPTTFNPGDQIDIRVTIAVTDAATVGTVKATLSKLALLCDVRG